MTEKNDYIKSPLNYVGGKYKLLSQILPLFPKNINTFVDLFGGGANVCVNVDANKRIYNDLNLKVVQILEYFSKHTVEEMLQEIDWYIEKYQLSKTNAEGFAELRTLYNKTCDNPIMLYTLICYSFNYQIRFNSKGEYNMPFGKERSSFNPVLREKFIRFCNSLDNIQFINSDFREFSNIPLEENSFVYCDPPYLNSTATYNENNGWCKEEETALRDLLVEYDWSDIKFALSNNAAINTTLIEWAKENGFNVHYLNADYTNCNYHKKDKEKKDIEVLITNY